MFEWLKRHFVPHVSNAYRPHFLLSQNIRQLLGIVLGFELVLFLLPTLFFPAFIGSFNLAAVLPGALSVFSNEERLENGLPELAENALLSKAAELKAADMAVKGYFAHTSPEGKSPWYWFDEVEYSYLYAGENLAVSFTDSREVTQAWMDSPTHRANIIGRNYTEIGTGIATGTYKGRESVFVAQLYARPAGVSSQVGAVPEASALKRTLLSPREAMNAVLYTASAIVLAALLLSLLLRADQKHPDLLRNGLFAAVFLAALYFGNSFISRGEVETSFLSFDPLQAEASAVE